MYEVIIKNEKGETKVLEGEFLLAIAGKNKPDNEVETDSVLLGNTGPVKLLEASINETIDKAVSLSLQEDQELNIIAMMISRLKKRFNGISEKKGFTYDILDKLK